MKRLAIPLTLLVALALVIGAAGCGANEEEEIRTLVDEQIAALNDLDLETVYDQRTPSYRSRVALEEYEGFLLAAYADFLPMLEGGQAEVEITDLDISVEDEWAYMTGNLALNGTVLLEYTEGSPDVWQKIDGTWYNLETNPLFPGYDPSELPD